MNVFLGRVVENKYYSQKGYINVILPQTLEEAGGERFFVDELSLEDINNGRIIPNYKDGFESDGISVKCKILMPMGAGEDCGMFTIPQINTTGLVAEINPENTNTWGSESRYIWLGGLYGGNMYGNGLSIPAESSSDMLNHTEESYRSDKNLEQSLRDEDIDTIKKSPYIDEGMFLIKLKPCKTSEITDSNSIEEKHIHYKTIPSPCEFSMKKTKVNLKFQGYDDDDNRTEINDITLDKDKVKITRLYDKNSNDSTRTEQIQIFDNEKIKLEFLNKKSEVDRVLEFNDNQIKLEFNNQQESKDVYLTFDKSGNVNVKASGNCNLNIGGNVNIKNDKGCEIDMGNTISIKNKYGNLFMLIWNLYEKLRNLHTEGTETQQSGTAWATEFVPEDQSTLEKLMHNGESLHGSTKPRYLSV